MNALANFDSDTANAASEAMFADALSGKDLDELGAAREVQDLIEKTLDQLIEAVKSKAPFVGMSEGELTEAVHDLEFAKDTVLLGIIRQIEEGERYL